jgi:hypothetical protein
LALRVEFLRAARAAAQPSEEMQASRLPPLPLKDYGKGELSKLLLPSIQMPGAEIKGEYKLRAATQ